MEHNVFECGICYQSYNETTNRPISLPCGHVFCEACIYKCAQNGNAVCPADKIKHNVQVSSLPYCYAILSNIPRQKPREACCSRHPKKKIKFLCEIHNEFLCSDCVIAHTGSDHSIVPYSARFDLMTKNIEAVQKSYIDHQLELHESAQAIDSSEKRLVDFHTAQLAKINRAYDNAVQLLNDKRKEMTEIVKRTMNEQRKFFEGPKIKLQSRSQKLQLEIKDMQKLAEDLDIISHEDYHTKMSEKSKALKSFTEDPLNVSVDCVYALFQDLIKFTEVGAIKHIKANDSRDKLSHSSNGAMTTREYQSAGHERKPSVERGRGREDYGGKVECKRCTFMNKEKAERCDGCGHLQKGSSSQMNSSIYGSDLKSSRYFKEDENWICQNCLFTNSKNKPQCAHCKIDRSKFIMTSRGGQSNGSSFNPSSSSSSNSSSNHGHTSSGTEKSFAKSGVSYSNKGCYTYRSSSQNPDFKKPNDLVFKENVKSSSNRMQKPFTPRAGGSGAKRLLREREELSFKTSDCDNSVSSVKGESDLRLKHDIVSPEALEAKRDIKVKITRESRTQMLKEELKTIKREVEGSHKMMVLNNGSANPLNHGAVNIHRERERVRNMKRRHPWKKRNNSI